MLFFDDVAASMAPCQQDDMMLRHATRCRSACFHAYAMRFASACHAMMMPMAAIFDDAERVTLPCCQRQLICAMIFRCLLIRATRCHAIIAMIRYARCYADMPP